MKNPVWPSCVAPAGTSNELDVQNEWEGHKQCYNIVIEEKYIYILQQVRRDILLRL